MGFQVSPGVEVKEIDLTNVIPAVSTSIGGYAGYFRWGPVNEIGLVGSEKELAGKFGPPDAATTQSFLHAASFLKYGNALKVVRASHAEMKNSVSGIFTQFDGSIDTITLDEQDVTQFQGLVAEPTIGIVDRDVDAATAPVGSGATLSLSFDVDAITGNNADAIASGLDTSGVAGVDTFVGVNDASRVAGTYNVSGSSTGTGATFDVVVSGGVISAGTTTANTDGNHITQSGLVRSFTGGTGTGASFTVVIDGSGDASITVANTGIGYTNGDVLTLAAADIPGTGTNDIVLTVSAVTTEVATITPVKVGSGYTDDEVITVTGDLGGGGDLTFQVNGLTTAGSGLYTCAASGADFIVGEELVVYTTDGDVNSTFTLQVNPDSNGIAVFTFESGLTDFSNFNTFPASVSSLGVFKADGTTAVAGLTVDISVKIADINSVNFGSEYNEATTFITFLPSGGTAPADVVDIAKANYTFTQVDDDTAVAQLIENVDQFETMTPSSSNLLGRMFARYAGAMGDSIEVYVLDQAAYTNADPLIQAKFDGAPAPLTADQDPSGEDTGKQFVHVLVVDEGGEITGTPGADLEKWSFLELTAGAKLADGSNNYYKDVVNLESNNIYIARDVVPAATAYTFSGGADAGAFTAGDIQNALTVLDDTELVDVNLLFAHEAAGRAVSKKLIEIASTRKDCVAFVSPLIGETVGMTNDTARTNVKDSIATFPRGVEGSYTVFDSTALYVYNKYADNYVYIPASGHMAGLCAKTDGLAEPWFSPAGFNRGSLLGVTKLAYNPKKIDRDELYKAGVNPIVSFPGQGILLFGDKTGQAKPSAFDRINVRRLFIVLEKAIATAAKYQLFELNDEFTRAMFRNMTEPFLRDVKGRRGITDFLVVCDETNNTGEVIDTNRFVADIYIKPARSINFITLNFIATRTGVDFSEIVGK